MRHNTIISSIFFLLIYVNSSGQDTKSKKVQEGRYLEVYNVLKKDEKVNHGQYLKFYTSMIDRKIPIEFGFFENGKRVGEWHFFYLNGALESYGNYLNGAKHGLWKEYYKPANDEESLSVTFFGHSDVKIHKNGSITVEKNDKLLSSIGAYESNMKIGSWNYYDNNGNLFHQYDHSLDKLLTSSVSDSMNLKYPFLGGIDRFIISYFDRREELVYGNNVPYSQVVIRISIINEKLTIEDISSTGDETVALEFEQFVRTFPNDWIGSYIENQVIVTLEHKMDVDKLFINITFDSQIDKY